MPVPPAVFVEVSGPFIGTSRCRARRRLRRTRRRPAGTRVAGAPRGQVEYARVARHDRAGRRPRRDRRPDAAGFPGWPARPRIASTANNARVAGRTGTGTCGATVGAVEKARVAGKPDLETDTSRAPRSVSFAGACRVWSRGTVVDSNKSTLVEFTMISTPVDFCRCRLREVRRVGDGRQGVP